MEQIHGSTPGDAAARPPHDSPPAGSQQVDGEPADGEGAQAHTPAAAADGASATAPRGFGSRGRMRRRARFLRKARELAYRDLGGLVFNLHRFGQRNDDLVLAKLNLLGQIDDELRALEDALQERHQVTVLREAGITACPRCAAIHGSEDRFCPNCGLSMGKHPDLPIAGAHAAPPAAAPAEPGSTQAPPAAGPPAATPDAPLGGEEPRTAVHGQLATPASGARPVPASPRPQGPADAPEQATAPFPSVARSALGRSPTPPRPDRDAAPPRQADGAADGDTEIVRRPAQSP